MCVEPQHRRVADEIEDVVDGFAEGAGQGGADCMRGRKTKTADPKAAVKKSIVRTYAQLEERVVERRWL